MADNVTFQTDRVATAPDATDVAAYDRDGVYYQRFMQGFDNLLLYYDGSGNVEYICKHSDPDAATSDTDWIIAKCSYDASNNFTGKLNRCGSVDGRVALFP